MRFGAISTGAIAWKRVQAYKNFGYRVAACTDRTPERSRRSAESAGVLGQGWISRAGVCARHKHIVRRGQERAIDTGANLDWRMQQAVDR